MIIFMLEAFSGVSGLDFYWVKFANADKGGENSGDDNDHDNDHDKEDSNENNDRDSRGKLDEVRDNVERKKLLSLSAVRSIVERKYGSNIIDVDVEKKKGRWVYEFKVISGKGRLLKIYVNAKTGVVIEVKND